MRKPGEFPFCSSGVHCWVCRSPAGGVEFRRSLTGIYSLPVADFDCPRLAWGSDDRPRVRIGDALAAILTWLGIRKWPGCGCDKRQAWLNRWGVVIIAGGAAGAIAWTWVMP